jgi:hypothetical protein
MWIQAMFRPRGAFRLATAACLAVSALAATHRGEVRFNGLPVPGVTVTAVRDGGRHVAITDLRGFYSFPDLPDGNWMIRVEMFGFATVEKEVAVTPDAPMALWELKLLPLDRIRAGIERAAVPVRAGAETAEPQTPAPQVPDDELTRRAADGFLINGSVNNGAASPFSQAAAFGNNRFGGRRLYTGGVGVILGNSGLDARPFSLTGQDTPKSAYNRTTGVLTLGGPLRIPRLFDNGPVFFLGYQWTRNNSSSTASALMPTQTERDGLLSTTVRDPLTGSPFAGNAIPGSRMSSQALALLGLYPLPNLSGGTRYNYQVPILSPTHQDAMQLRLNRTLGRRDQVNGRFAFQSTRSGNPNVFGFLDTTDSLGWNTAANWSHRFSQTLFLNLGYEFSRASTRVTPYFANRYNVSGQAGIAGNDQSPANWGPPALNFSGGIAALSDSQSSFNRNQTSAVSFSMMWNRRAHNISLGGDFRRQQFNRLAQENPRGTLTFTGAATGSDFGDFLLGIPAASSLAFGNADKYFRQSVYDAFIADDWRIHSGVTVNAGLRWEYGAPITELYGRLVNLDIAPGYTAAVPVLASSPAGSLTGRDYPASLVRPDKLGFEPRVGVAWRPMAGSSLILRAGYGVYRDTSVYQGIVPKMAQQPPLSKTLSAQNSQANPLTLANAFVAPASGNTFALDPDFRAGYAQNWQFSVQRDLPASLQMTATYLGIKGTRGMQEFLPNTWPTGAVNPCPACPSGFVYLTSNGNSTRQAAQIQLRRRLRSGLAATMQYTFSKSIDNVAALGVRGGSGNSGAAQPASSAASASIAQNWRDLRGERGLSTFDQRHLLNLRMQYTSGMGLRGGTLLGGWTGALLKDWTLSSTLTAGSGLPQTPVYMVPVEGTGITGTIRPDYTGAPLYEAPAGFHLNPAAYTAPRAGQWGNAGRNSITGPAQFTLNASMARTFRVGDRLNLDLRVDSTNLLNHVTYTTWNTTIGSAQFGLPAAANAMRSLETSLRLRF